jgi:hypothetical protein
LPGLVYDALLYNIQQKYIIIINYVSAVFAAVRKSRFGNGEGGALRGVDRPSVRIDRSVLGEEGRVRSVVTGTLLEDRRVGVPSIPGGVKIGGTPY